jgi:hypothetical protein
MSTTTTGAVAARSGQAMPDLPRYLDLLITRFATHGTSDNPAGADAAICGRVLKNSMSPSYSN